MTHDLLIGLIGFALVGTITPGPNNLMLMTSGANFGFRRTIPHMLGIGLGFALMIALVGIGLAQAFEAFPILHTVLKVVSIGYMVWLAWKIANAASPEKSEATGRPMNFLQAAAFQWVNPKAWAMGLTAVTVYAPSKDAAGAIFVALIFCLASIPSVTSWTVIGQQMRRLLTNPKRLTIFNWSMAALLIASLYPVL